MSVFSGDQKILHQLFPPIEDININTRNVKVNRVKINPSKSKACGNDDTSNGESQTVCDANAQAAESNTPSAHVSLNSDILEIQSRNHIHYSREEEQEYVARLQCVACLEVFKNDLDFLTHQIDADHLGRYCVVCHKGYSSKTSFKKHISSIHIQDSRHQCAVCHVGFTDKAKLNGQIRKVHPGCELLSCWK